MHYPIAYILKIPLNLSNLFKDQSIIIDDHSSQKSYLMLNDLDDDSDLDLNCHHCCFFTLKTNQYLRVNNLLPQSKDFRILLVDIQFLF